MNQSADDLRLMLDDLLDRTSGWSFRGYSQAEILDIDIGGHQHVARLAAARARFWAAYGDESLRLGDLAEARTAVDAGTLYLAEAGLAVARRDDLDRIATPPAKRGPKGWAAKRLYFFAEAIRRRDGVTIVEACRRAVAADDALAARYRRQSDTALNSAFKRGREAVDHT